MGLMLIALREGEPPSWDWFPTDFAAAKQAY